MAEVVASATVAMLAFVLAAAGVAKLTTRGAGVTLARGGQAAAEFALAAAALCLPSRPLGAALAATFAAFAFVHARARNDQQATGCDCFGEATGLAGPAGWWRLGLTAASAALAVAAALLAPPSPLRLVIRHPGAGLLALLAGGLAAAAWRAAFTGTARPRDAPARPVTDRLVAGSARFLERRTSRRGFLVRLAAVGSALTVAPLRYILYPGDAIAALSPSDCANGACTDGYTAFCCQIDHGLNSCPTGTFPGGWWMCTDYPGRKLCAEQGVRYYVDCNALPGHAFPGGCHCANGDCAERRVACNVFRYGQCNVHIPGVTAVVCRMVVCENPSQIPDLNCSSSMAVDDAVCTQDAHCLEPAITVGAPGGV